MDQIKSITVRSSATALSAAHRLGAATGLEGKFSIPYCVANALLRDNTGMQAFTDEKVNDPEVQGFMKKISLVKDEEKLALEADVEMETSTGETHSAFSDILQEVPPLEVKKVKLRAKFEDLVSPVLGNRKTEEIRDAILSLDKLEDVGVLLV
jgi:2-methylcitrate dehydratase PrpD